MVSLPDGKQEALLSHRDRVTLRVNVIEYFAKSLKVTQGRSKCVGRA